jgi:hypothetical protein
MWAGPQSTHLPWLTLVADSRRTKAKLRSSTQRLARADLVDGRGQGQALLVLLEREAWKTWLHDTDDEAMAALKLPPLEYYRQGPEDSARALSLPIRAASDGMLLTRATVEELCAQQDNCESAELPSQL